MKCKQHELAFEDYDAGRLSPAETRELEKHLAACPQCRTRLEDWRLGGKALAPARMPKASEAFKAHLLKHLEAYPLATPPKSLWIRVREVLLYPLQMRWPAQALAGALVIVAAIVVYEQFTPPVPVEKGIGGPLATRKAEHPIEIFASNPDRALADLTSLAASHGGQLVRRRPVETGTEVTLRIDERSTPALINELPRLGRLTVPEKGYKDGAGNVVVILRPAPAK